MVAKTIRGKTTGAIFNHRSLSRHCVKFVAAKCCRNGMVYVCKSTCTFLFVLGACCLLDFQIKQDETFGQILAVAVTDTMIGAIQVL